MANRFHPKGKIVARLKGLKRHWGKPTKITVPSFVVPEISLHETRLLLALALASARPHKLNRPRTIGVPREYIDAVVGAGAGVKRNLLTYSACRLKMPLLVKGQDKFYDMSRNLIHLPKRKTNAWGCPEDWDGSLVEITLWLAPGQRERWMNRKAIMEEIRQRNYPEKKWACEVYKRMELGAVPGKLTTRKKRESLENWKERENQARKKVRKVRKDLKKVKSENATGLFIGISRRVTLTEDGDILSHLTRLAKRARLRLKDTEYPYARSEVDLSSAHLLFLPAAISSFLGRSYPKSFLDQYALDYRRLYGVDKKLKVQLLTGLNMEQDVVERMPSWKRLMELYPDLARDVAYIKRLHGPLSVGGRLRELTAHCIMPLFVELASAGYSCFPVTDCLNVLAKDADMIALRLKERAESIAGVTAFVTISR